MLSVQAASKTKYMQSVSAVSICMFLDGAYRLKAAGWLPVNGLFTSRLYCAALLQGPLWEVCAVCGRMPGRADGVACRHGAGLPLKLISCTD